MQITIRQAAQLLGASERQLYRWIDEGEIPVYRVNDQLWFNQTELLEWATARRIPVSGEIFRDPEGDEKPMPSLAQALRAGGIYHHVPGGNRESALRAVVERIPLANPGDREFIFQMLLAREASGSTAIGDGIAIPHVRNPVVLNGAAVAITLCTFDKAVDFGAHDGSKVHTIFSIVTPTIRTHLQMLAKLAAALHDRAFRAAVLERAAATEILKHAERLDTASGLAGSQRWLES